MGRTEGSLWAASREEPGAGPFGGFSTIRWRIFAGARRADLRIWHSFSLCSADASGGLCGVNDRKGAERHDLLRRMWVSSIIFPML